jgi:hypothetical protein
MVCAFAFPSSALGRYTVSPAILELGRDLVIGDAAGEGE